MKLKLNNPMLVPTKEIDEVWHLHMESPVSYYNDCLSFCGKIIDHDSTITGNKLKKRF